MNYKELLEQSFKDNNDDDTKLEYLGKYIFNFTTYDGEMDVLLATKALQVCEAISNRTTFEYIKDSENYRWYIIMCNMDFFDSRIEWGTSIRGAWWDCPTTLRSCGIWQDGKQVLEMKFSQDRWQEFVSAMIEFAKE